MTLRSYILGKDNKNNSNTFVTIETIPQRSYHYNGLSIDLKQLPQLNPSIERSFISANSVPRQIDNDQTLLDNYTMFKCSMNRGYSSFKYLQCIRQLPRLTNYDRSISYDSNVKDLKSNSKYNIEDQCIEKNGTNFPFNLYVINESRKFMIRGIMEKKQLQDQDVILQKTKEELMEVMRNKERVKKKKDCLSRGQMDNTLYSLYAMGSDSKKRTKQIISITHSKESRFQQF